jgi:hypothetical protein
VIAVIAAIAVIAVIAVMEPEDHQDSCIYKYLAEEDLDHDGTTFESIKEVPM